MIGATLVLADGTVARSGGHVIKNVAGYDLTKLVHGAYGTLAVIAEVVLRLHPLPHAAATLVAPVHARGGRGARRPGPRRPVRTRGAGVGVGPPGRAARAGPRARGHAAAADRGHRGRAPATAWRGCGGCSGPCCRAGRRGRLGRARAAHPRHRRRRRAAARCAPVPAARGARRDAGPVDHRRARHRRRHRRAAAGPRRVAAAHAAVHAAGGTSVLRSRPAGSPRRRGVRRPPRWRCSVPSRRRSTPPGRLGPGRFAPWLP